MMKVIITLTGIHTCVVGNVNCEPRARSLKRAQLGQSLSNCNPRFQLHREIHAAHQVLKAWIGTQIVEDRVNLKEDHPIAALLVGGFEPTEGFFRLPQSSVDPAYSIR